MTFGKLGCAILAALAVLGVAAHAQPCLIISEVVDADLPGGLPKFVELTNTGTTSIDLSEYSLGSVNNGLTESVTAPVTLSGILHPGHSYVCSFEAGDYPPDHGTFYDVYGFFPDNYEFEAWFNGNDVIILYAGNPGAPHHGTVEEGMIDIYGRVGEGGGEVPFDWDYTDGYAYRDYSVNQPNQTFAASDWSIHALALEDQDAFIIDYYTTPGQHGYAYGCGSGLVVGRCCVDWMCYVVQQATCTTMGGVWAGSGSTCDGTPCGTPPPTGACCYGETCMVQTQAECTGDYQGDGTYCSPNPCLECVTIPEAREITWGSEVELCEVVVTNVLDTVASTSVKSFHAQELDGSGGITIFGDNVDIDEILNMVDPGDTIQIQGTTADYSGLFELEAPFIFSVLTTGGDVPEPTTITALDFNDTYESMLVVIECASFRDAGGTFYGYSNYTVDTEFGSFTARVASDDLPIAGTTIPTGMVDVVGILSQYGDYQLMLLETDDIIPNPTCMDTGACCLPPDFTVCQVTTDAECAALEGNYQGGGTRCMPWNPCVEAFGACCLASGLCQEMPQAACETAGGGYMGDYTACDATTCAKPGLGGDIALGLSTADGASTAPQIRDDGTGTGIKVGAWTLQPYLQSFEYDNTGGVLHNALGNLLAINYGSAPTSSDPGMKLYNCATDGTSRIQGSLFNWNGTDQGGDAQYNTRGGGLSVSSDNKFIATHGTDKTNAFILAYDEGPNPGSGTGAQITGSWYLATGGQTTVTQGTTWYWNPATEDPQNPTTYKLLVATAATNVVNVKRIQFNAPDPSGGLTIAQVATVQPATTATIKFTDIDYNPDVSPYVYVIMGTANPYATFIAVINPTTWTVIRGSASSPAITMTSSSETGRECALGPDGYLYWSQYHSGTGASFVDRVNIDVDPLTIADGSSSDYYSGDTYSSYNGIDVAFPSGVASGACCLGGGNCSVLSEAACDAVGGTWVGADTTCNPNPCCATIPEAKLIGPDAPVMLCDVLVSSTADLVNSTSSKSFHVQQVSGLGGITVFGYNEVIDAILVDNMVVPGDIITLQGVTDEFNGLFELVGPFNFLGKSGTATVVATPVTAVDFQEGSPTAESYESMLVVASGGLTFVDAGGTFAYGNYTVTDGINSFTMRVATSDHPLVGQPIPTCEVAITGIFSQSDYTEPFDGYYQLLPRFVEDVACDTPPLCPGDMNCDGVVNYSDIDYFVAALSCIGGAPTCWPPAGVPADCPWLNGDCNDDGNVTYADIDPFVGRIGATCN